MNRPLTVEEALALPPPTEEEIAQRRRAVAGLAEVARRVRERLGRDITDEEFEWALRRDDDEEEWVSPPK